MPEPLPLGRVLGPSVILAGLGVGSGEYIIWPFMTATVGTFFLWAAVLSVTVQYFLNMEIERYTLATGETAVAGFVRFWKPWGVLFCFFTIVPNMWPGWATSGVTILGFPGGSRRRAPGDHRHPGRLGHRAHRLPHRLSDARASAVLQGRPDAGVSGHRDRRPPSALRPGPSCRRQSPGSAGFLILNVIPIALMLSGLVFAGAGGVNNLCQSNWIRDKGFGMGIYIPRIVSPITGEEVAAPATGSMMRQDAENLRRFRGWWAVANREQLVSFWFICVFSITVFSTLAYSTVFGQTIRRAGQSRIHPGRRRGAEALVAPWFGTFFWVFGALSMILVALGDHRLHRAHRGRRAQDGVPAGQPAVDREPPVLPGRVGHDRRRFDHPAVGFQSAVAAAGHRRVSQRHGDVRLLDPADPAQPARAAAGHSRVAGSASRMLVFATLFYGFFAGWLVLVQVRGYLATG